MSLPSHSFTPRPLPQVQVMHICTVISACTRECFGCHVCQELQTELILGSKSTPVCLCISSAVRGASLKNFTEASSCFFCICICSLDNAINDAVSGRTS